MFKSATARKTEKAARDSRNESVGPKLQAALEDIEKAADKDIEELKARIKSIRSEVAAIKNIATDSALRNR